MSIAINVAKAVVAQLNSKTYSPAFTAKFYYNVEFDKVEWSTLTVPVSVRNQSVSPFDRQDKEWLIEVNIGILKNISGDGDCDILMTLTETIIEDLLNESLTTYQDAYCVKIENNPIYAPDYLLEKNQFVSVLTATYQVISNSLITRQVQA